MTYQQWAQGHLYHRCCPTAYNGATNCRVAYRFNYTPTDANYYLGFRLAL